MAPQTPRPFLAFPVAPRTMKHGHGRWPRRASAWTRTGACWAFLFIKVPAFLWSEVVSHALQFPSGSAFVMYPHLLGCFSYILCFASEGSNSFKWIGLRVYKAKESIKYSVFYFIFSYSEPTHVNSFYLTKLLIALTQKSNKIKILLSFPLYTILLNYR